MNTKSSFNFAKKFPIDPNSESFDLDSLEFHPQLIKNLNLCGFSKLFPIQYNVIKYFYENIPLTPLKRVRDICVLYPTGSGKTLCYAIPIISSFINCFNKSAFIIAPSKALCLQIFEIFQKLSLGFNIHITLDNIDFKNLNDSKNIIKSSLKNDLNNKCIIYILTPPRLKKLSLKSNKKINVDFLIFDEADKLFKHNPDWLEPLESLCGSHNTSSIENWLKNKPPLKFCTSATLKDDPDFICDMKLYLPIIFTNNISSNIILPVNLIENLIYCDQVDKVLILIHVFIEFISSNNLQILCFVNFAKKLNKLVKLLDKKYLINSTLYHPDLPENRNKKNLDKFVHGSKNVMFCTDYLSRGIDMPDVGMVVNYDLPTSFENYVHRVGRTCRGNKKGYAITFLDEDLKENLPKYLKNIEENSNHSVLKYDSQDLDYLRDWYSQSIKTIK